MKSKSEAVKTSLCKAMFFALHFCAKLNKYFKQTKNKLWKQKKSITT